MNWDGEINGVGRLNAIINHTLHYSTYPDNLLDLALSVTSKLGSSAGDGQLASLLDLGLEDHLVALAPHLSDEGLAGDDNTGEADLDVLEGAETLVHGLSGDAERAETVEDGGLETTHLGEAGIDVERADMSVRVWWIGGGGTYL